MNAAPARAQGAVECTPLPRDPTRIALVLGNAAYRSSPPLPNAANDARAVREVLERCLGFTVLLAQDLGRDAIVQQVREFAGRIVPGGVALFYYAGHGVEQDGRNYLIPASHRIRSRADIPVEAYPIDDVVKRMEAGTGEGGVNIVIVDACRDNPLPAVPGEGRSFGWRSLAPVETQSGTLVMHSTRSGAQALDQIPGTKGTNSPFTTALLTQIVRIDITLRDLPYEVTADVRRLTERVQEPWSSASYVPPIRLAAAGGSLVIERPVPGTRLRVTSLPTGAQVTIDGRAAGTAPLDAAGVQPGEVLVRATLAGHEPAESRTTLQAGTSHEVQLVLTAIARTARLLTVDAQPTVATIRIVDGPPYQPGIELPIGNYVLEVTASATRSRHETIQLARADQRVVVRLTRALGATSGATAREIAGLPGASVPGRLRSTPRESCSARPPSRPARRWALPGPLRAGCERSRPPADRVLYRPRSTQQATWWVLRRTHAANPAQRFGQPRPAFGKCRTASGSVEQRQRNQFGGRHRRNSRASRCVQLASRWPRRGTAGIHAPRRRRTAVAARLGWRSGAGRHE